MLVGPPHDILAPPDDYHHAKAVWYARMGLRYLMNIGISTFAFSDTCCGPLPETFNSSSNTQTPEMASTSASLRKIPRPNHGYHLFHRQLEKHPKAGEAAQVYMSDSDFQSYHQLYDEFKEDIARLTSSDSIHYNF